MTTRRKEVTMLVTVSVPRWLTAAQARREVRTLIAEQCFYGHQGGGRHMLDEIDESNFKVRRVAPVQR